MTRNGKIARLPHFIREELNQRLFDGESGVKLIDWLNDQDAVWEVLEENDFDPITEQNLSEWKSGGYQSWVDNREARELVMRMSSRADDLGESTDGANLGDGLATLLMVELIKVARVLVQQEEDPQKRWKELRRVGRELSRHRKDRSRDIRSDISQKRCDWAQEDRERKLATTEKEQLKKQQLAPYDLDLALHLKAERLGGSPAAKRMAAHLLEVQHDLPKGRLTHQDNGVWMWEEDEWVWYVDRRKEGRGFVPEEWVEVKETPESENQTPKRKGGKKGKPRKVRTAPAKKKAGAKAKKTKHPKSRCQHPEPTDESQKAEETSQGSTESRPTNPEANQGKIPPNPTESDQIQPFNE